MKAIVYEKYGGPEVLQLKEIEKPIPKENEVLIKVKAVSINPYEWHFMRGKPWFMRLSASGLFKPKNKIRILGNDVAGYVEAVGSAVKEFKSGDEVWAESDFGSLAEYVCASANKTISKPNNCTLEEAACLPIAGITALQSLRDDGQLKAGQEVLINGASGGVGTFAVQIAKALGAQVTGVCSGRNLDLVRSLGANRVIDYTKEKVTQNGQTYDLVVDNVGNLSVKTCKRLLKPGGLGVIVGYQSVPHLIAVGLRGKTQHSKVAYMSAKTTREDLLFLKQLIEEGKLQPIIDRKYPLEKTAEAMAYLEGGHAPGKVIITV